jgi:hypothetical protein
VIAYFWAVHTITFAEVRYSEPLHPLLAILVAGAFARRASSALSEPERAAD